MDFPKYQTVPWNPILSFQASLYHTSNRQANCISELSASIEHTSQMCRLNRHISSFSFITHLFQYFLWIVIARLMYWHVYVLGFAYDCVSGSGEQTERDALTHGDVQNQVEHRRGKYICSFSFFFFNQCIFYPWWWWQAEGVQHQQARVKKKKWRRFCSSFNADPPPVCCFCFIFPFFKSGSKMCYSLFSVLIVQLNYVSLESEVSVQQASAATRRYRFSHRRGPTFYCMLVALKLHFCW